MILLLGCVDASDPCPGGEAATGGRVCTAPVTLRAELGTLDAELRWPAEADGSWPAAVVIPGGFDPYVLPVRQGTPMVNNAEGVVSLHLDLAGPAWGDGVDDHRGPLARAAVATGVAFLAGRAADATGRSVLDLAPGTRTDRLVLAGHSNGGNLAVATLADESLSLPGVVGLATFETPAGPQFVNVEHGGLGLSYATGTCTAGADGIDCPFTTEQAALSAEGEVCVDVDEDQLCGATENTVGGSLDPATSKRALSPRLRGMVDAEGLPAGDYDTLEEADDFWGERDAARLVAEMARVRPVPTVVVGTEEDHVLVGLADHPHVFGLYELLHQAGVAVRLNPGAAWTGLGAENDVGAPYGLSNAEGWLVPESTDVTLQDLLTAGTRELCARTDDEGW